MATVTDLGTNKILRQWPAPHDFNEAMQNQEICFDDEGLRSAQITLDGMGLPRPISGNFASIYQLDSGGRRYAVKCFLRYVPDQCIRYAHIASSLSSFSASAQRTSILTEFDFIEKGIKIGNNWFPILKMEWIDGESLDVFIDKRRNDPLTIPTVAREFAAACKALHAADIAHGDLQHGNILVMRDHQIRLVDYDGMFVPGMQGLSSAELGHRNYQHPDRSSIHFGSYLDHFSSLLIYSSLQIMAADPSLRARVATDDALLLTAEDISRRHSSAKFLELESHPHSEVRRWSRLIRWQADQPIESLQPFWEIDESRIQLPEIQHVDSTSCPQTLLGSFFRSNNNEEDTSTSESEIRQISRQYPRREVRRKSGGFRSDTYSAYRDWSKVFLVSITALIVTRMLSTVMPSAGYAASVSGLDSLTSILNIIIELQLIILSLLLLDPLISLRRQKRLCQRGHAVTGTIVAVKPTAWKSRFDLVVHCPSYTSKLGLHRSDIRIRVRGVEEEKARPQYGQQVTLLYMPKEPLNTILYEFSDFEVLPSAA